MITPGKGTRDLYGPSGLTTVQFVNEVKSELLGNVTSACKDVKVAAAFNDPYEYDVSKVKEMFDSIDTDKNGVINFDEFSIAIKKLGIAPRKL